MLNPATGAEIGQAPQSGAEDVDRAVAAATRAFETWGRTTPAERAAALLRLADAIEEHADEIAALEPANAGKPIEAVKADNLRFFAGAARCMEGRAAGEYTEGYTPWIRREPSASWARSPRGTTPDDGAIRTSST